MLAYEADQKNARLVLARTIYGEARGEGREGMQAVANVVMNRTRLGGWWGSEVAAVCLKPWQFSVWNEGDPNRELILSKRPGDGDAVFDEAWEIAGAAINGGLPDITGGATHYHTTAVSPGWMDPAKQVATIGAHVFYRGIA